VIPTKAEFKSFTDKHGLDRHALSKIFPDRSIRTIDGWIGGRTVPPDAWKLLNVMYKGEEK